MKVQHIKRDRKREKELQNKLLDLSIEYKGVPMLFMNNLKVSYGKKNILLDLSHDEYFFVINGCIFLGNNSQKKEYGKETKVI